MFCLFDILQIIGWKNNERPEEKIDMKCSLKCSVSILIIENKILRLFQNHEVMTNLCKSI